MIFDIKKHISNFFYKFERKLGENTIRMSAYIYIKDNVSLHEYNMHNYIHANLSEQINLPKIIKYERKTNKLYMQQIGGMSVADFYGTEAVPAHIFTEIRRIIRILKDHHIVYPDITGYNFIQDSKENIWIIDFEHCYFDYGAGDEFVNKFIDGANKWNPDFE